MGRYSRYIIKLFLLRFLVFDPRSHFGVDGGQSLAPYFSPIGSSRVQLLTANLERTKTLVNYGLSRLTKYIGPSELH